MAPWGPRVAETSTNSGEGDKLFVYGQYSGPSGQLLVGMPLYKDVSDPAEYGFINPTTQVTVGPNAKLQSAGKVTLAAQNVGSPMPITPGATVNINAGAISVGAAPVFVGAFSPSNPTDRPSTGDVVRLTRFGVTPIAVSAGQVVNVGDLILTQEASPYFTTAPPGVATQGGLVSVGYYAGRVVATGTQISGGGAIVVPTAASGTAGLLNFLVNGWIDK